MEMTNIGNSFNQQPNQNFYTQQLPQRSLQMGNPYPQVIPPKMADYVQGELAATIYPVGYNQEVTLIDVENTDMVYKRSRDNTGKLSPLQKFKLTPVEDKKSEEIDFKNFVKQDEILDLIAETVENAVQKEVEKKLSELTLKPTSREDRQ